MRLLVIGASTTAVCGVRDCAGALEPAFARAGVDVETVWWERGETGMRTWTADVARAARRVDGVLWHYSVFAYGVRGVPVLLGPALAALRASSARPTVGFLHELAHQGGSARTTVHAWTQRAALAVLVRRLDGLVVAAEDRLRWLRSRRWLPERPACFVPLVSNVPVAAAKGAVRNGAFRIGVFGFRREALPPEEIVVLAVRRLREHGIDARLELVGAPGSTGPSGTRWREAAARAGCAEALSFTGILEPETLSQRLSSLDAAVFTDYCGPTPRRGTLAALLAHGRPIVAFDGPQRWQALADEEAVALTARDPEALAAELERFASDPERRQKQGERAREFYERRMTADAAVARMVSLFEEVAT